MSKNNPLSALFVLIVVVLTISNTACAPVAQETPEATSLVPKDGNIASIMESERAAGTYWAARGITYEPMSEEERDEIRRSFANENEEPFAIAFIDQAGYRLAEGTATATPILIPAMQVAAQQNWADLYRSAGSASLVVDGGWLQLFHWINHLPEQAGVNMYDLTASAAYLNQVVQAALNGDGMVYYRPASGVLKEAYMFVGRLDGKQWSVLLDSTGSPITAFNCGYRGGCYNEAQALRYVAKSLTKGFVEVPTAQVPSAIRENWNSSSPPLWRLWWWAVSAQVREQAARTAVTTAQAGEAFAALFGGIMATPVMIFIPPGMLPTAENIQSN